MMRFFLGIGFGGACRFFLQCRLRADRRDHPGGFSMSAARHLQTTVRVVSLTRGAKPSANMLACSIVRTLAAMRKSETMTAP